VIETKITELEDNPTMTLPFPKLIALGIAALLVVTAGCSDGESPDAASVTASPIETETELEKPDNVAVAPEISTDIEEPDNVAVAPAINSNAWQYLYDNRQELQVCDGSLDPEISQEQSETYAVGENKNLVQVLCFLAAYQGAYQYYLYSETDNGPDVNPLTFTTYIVNENGEYEASQERDLGGLPTFDPEQQILTIFSKGRGLGDCGSWAQYQLEGNEFQLLEYRAKDDCDGNYVEPDQYPQIYP
jgi:hypothetical protein